MTINRRPHSNASQTQVTTLRSAAIAADRLKWSDVVPPAPDPAVRAIELRVMDATFAARAPNDWTDLDIILVTRFAAQLAALLKDEELLRRSGSLVRSGKHNTAFIRNPLLDSVATRSCQVGQLMRQLGVSVPAVDRRQLAASGRVLDAMRVFEDDDDGLFARPTS